MLISDLIVCACPQVEYMIVKFDHDQKKTRAALRAEELLRVMDKREAEEGEKRSVLWRPEFGAYMIEGTPGQPYGDNGQGQNLYSNFNVVEANMRLRRAEIDQLLGGGDTMLVSLTSFPRLGCPDFTDPHKDPNPVSSVTGSIFFPDEAIFGGHPRYK